VTGCCENGNEPVGSIRGREFFSVSERLSASQGVSIHVAGGVVPFERSVQ
jgi:hypothetical protein